MPHQHWMPNRGDMIIGLKKHQRIMVINFVNSIWSILTYILTECLKALPVNEIEILIRNLKSFTI